MSFTPENFAVRAEIPVTDLDRAIAFYGKVFDTELNKDESRPNPMAVFQTSNGGGVSGHLYTGTSAPEGVGPTVHLACPDALEDALDRVKQAGGRVLSEPITIPAGRFAYCLDLDGNSIGIFSR